MSSVDDLWASLAGMNEKSPHYHVAIKLKSDNPLLTHRFAFDLSLEAVKRNFVDPYCQGQSIFIDGSSLAREDIERITIVEHIQASGFIRSGIESEVRDSLRRDPIFQGLSRDFPNAAPHYLDHHVSMRVMSSGRDITDELIRSASLIQGQTGTDRSRALHQTQNPRKVFVVHGRNTAARDAMFSFLRAIGLDPMEWGQAVRATQNPSPYTGDILDAAFSQAQAVLVLLTPDDEARLRKRFRRSDDEPDESTLMGQPRPNVLFEAGMARGRFPSRTVIVEVGRVKPFSDIAGLHVMRLDGSVESRQMLIERLELAHCAVDWTGKTDWHAAGDFRTAIQLAEAADDGSASSGVSDNDDKDEIVIKSQLTESAVHMLTAAVKSIDGSIDVIQLDHGVIVEANGVNYCDTGNRGSEAAARAVLTELVKHGLIEDQSGNGAEYVVTEKGFRNVL